MFENPSSARPRSPCTRLTSASDRSTLRIPTCSFRPPSAPLSHAPPFSRLTPCEKCTASSLDSKSRKDLSFSPTRGCSGYSVTVLGRDAVVCTLAQISRCDGGAGGGLRQGVWASALAWLRRGCRESAAVRRKHTRERGRAGEGVRRRTLPPAHEDGGGGETVCRGPRPHAPRARGSAMPMKMAVLSKPHPRLFTRREPCPPECRASPASSMSSPSIDCVIDIALTCHWSGCRRRQRNTNEADSRLGESTSPHGRLASP